MKGIKKYTWESIFYEVLWSIWLARNELVLDASSVGWDEVAELAKVRVAIWVIAAKNIKEYSIQDFIRCLEGIKNSKIDKSSRVLY